MMNERMKRLEAGGTNAAGLREKNHTKYMELVKWIQDQIADKRFLPGQKMCSENELKNMFGVSRQTVRHAISILENEDILVRKRGSGTYINDKRRNNLENRKSISVVTTYVDSYIFPKTIQGIENVLFEKGYSVQIAFTNNQISREKTILEDILSRDEVAGIIMETTKSGIPNPNIPLYEELQKRNIPVLFINSYYPNLSIPHISLNDRMAGRKAAGHLIDMGHRKIGGIFKLDDGQGHMRYAGYLDALQNTGIVLEDSHVVWIDTISMQNLEECRDRILNRLKGCTAAVCYNDQVAFELMEIFKTEKIKVPQDISIVSIDDSELAVLGDIALTSIPHPTDRLGDKAAVTLIKMINNIFMDGTYEFDAEIVCRDSVKNIL